MHSLRSRRTNTASIFFPAAMKAPIVVFIHGGYWQALDSSFFSHLARGLNAHGIGVAIPGYDLCPDVTVDHIIQQMRMATRELARLGHPLVDQRPFRWRTSRRLHAGDRLAGIRCFVARGSRHRGLRHFRPVRPWAAGRNVHQQGIASRRGDGEGREPVVLERAIARKPRCGGRRKRKRGISPAKPDHRRALGRGRACHAVRRYSRRQPFRGDCAPWPIRTRRWCRA